MTLPQNQDNNEPKPTMRIYGTNIITNTIVFFWVLWLIGCAESTAQFAGRMVGAFWLAFKTISG